MQGIYSIVNLIDNKMYIGQSVNIEKRWSDHKYRAFYKEGSEYNSYLYNAIKKHGIENFRFSVLEEVEDTDLLTPREIYWIEVYNPDYNMLFPRDTPIQSYHSKSVLKIDKETKEIIKEYKSASEAERLDNFNHRHISEACRGILKTHKGFIWKFKEDV